MCVLQYLCVCLCVYVCVTCVHMQKYARMHAQMVLEPEPRTSYMIDKRSAP